MNLISQAWAQAQATPAAAGAQPGGLSSLLMPMAVVFVIFYFLIFRPQQKTLKQKKEMLSALKRGDEVVTSGGLYGKVVEIADATVMLQIAANVNVKVDRNLIVAVTNPIVESKPKA